MDSVSTISTDVQVRDLFSRSSNAYLYKIEDGDAVCTVKYLNESEPICIRLKIDQIFQFLDTVRRIQERDV